LWALWLKLDWSLTVLRAGAAEQMGYAWICLSLLIAAIPFRWPARADLTALGSLLFSFCPLSLSIGTPYLSALLAMTISGFPDYWSRSRNSILGKNEAAPARTCSRQA
jgi:hypothetical protein